MPKIERQDLDGCDADIATLYLRTAAKEIKRIEAAIRSTSMANVQQFAHKLSGSSAFLGLRDMAKLLSELEKAAARNESGKVSRLLSLTRKEFGQIQHHRLSKRSNGKTSSTGAPLSQPEKRFKIFIVDDHPLIRQGLAHQMQLQPDLKICGQAATAHEALKAIDKVRPDLVILDITLTGSDGMSLIKDMKLRSLKCFILVLSMHDESLYAERTLKAGAQGYIMKHEAPSELLKAVYCVLDGEIYLSKTMEAKMLHKIADSASSEKTLPEGSLSDRELQTFQLIGQGRGTREIAAELNISPKTVESYRAHIKVKMNLKNARELTQYAIHWVERKHLN
jgi:DNA-binding NarL/FixJ family response regulator/HPt (histidine-containing phosphotransfer) domain-containing protein